MNKITLDHCVITGIKADLVKGSVTLTLRHALDDQVRVVQRTLAYYAFNQDPVTIDIEAAQLPLPFKEKPHD